MAGLPLVAGGLTAAQLAIACGIVLTSAYIAWQVNQSAEVIAGAARDVQKKFADTAWVLGKMGIDMVVPTSQQLERQIGDLFRGMRDGAVSMGDMGSRLVENIWPGSQESSTGIGAGTSTGSAPAQPQRPAVSTPSSASVSPAQRAPVTALPAAMPMPVALTDLPIGRQQIALNQSGIDNVTAANQSMASGSALLPSLNQSLRQFYFSAAGGAAARTQGQLQHSIAQVQQIKDQLAQIVSGSNESVAGIQAASRALQRIYGNPANAGQLFANLSQSIAGLNQSYSEQSTMRNDFKALVNRLDTWLSQAYKHAADGFQALPAPPLPVLSPSGIDANAVATDLQTAALSAQEALGQSNAQRSRPAVATPPTIAPVATAPATIGWFNPATGAFSQQQSGAGAWPVNAHFVDRLPGTGQRMTMNVEGEPVDVEVVGPTPGPGSNSGNTASNAAGNTFNFYVVQHGQPGGGDKGPNWRQQALAALVTGMLAAPGAYFVNRTAEGERMGTLQPDFTNADKSAQTLLGGLGPNSSEAQIKDVREAVWRSYFEAGNTELQDAKWLPIGGGGAMFSGADMHNIRAEQERFLVGLRSQPVPSRNGGEVGLGAFTRAPVLEGDPLKTQHFNSVMQKVNAEVRQQLALVPGRTAGDAKVGAFTPRPFDVDAYVRQHGSELTSDAGKKTALVALWRHHLGQVLPALGNSRTTPEQRESFRVEAERWLSSPRLDPSQLALLPGNDDARPVLASTIAAAGRDADRLAAQWPKQPSLLDQLRQAPVVPGTPNSTRPPTAQTTPSAEPTTPTQGVDTAPRDADAVLGDVNRAVASARLSRPPQATSLEQVRFTPDMFFTPGQSRTAAAIDDAKVKANNLFLAIKTIGLANPIYNASFAELLNAFNTDVLIPLGQLQPPDVAPSVPVPATQE